MNIQTILKRGNVGRKSKSEERRAEILDHYYRVILEEGYENTSIAKIAAHMDVRPSLIMHYFPSKEEMTLELTKKCLKEYVDDKVEAIYASENNPLKRVKALKNFHQESMKISANKPLITIMSLLKYLSTHNEKIKAAMVEINRKYRRLAIEQLDILYNEGIIKNSDTESLADLILLSNAAIETSSPFMEETTYHIAQDDFAELIKIKMNIDYDKIQEKLK